MNTEQIKAHRLLKRTRMPGGELSPWRDEGTGIEVARNQSGIFLRFPHPQNGSFQRLVEWHPFSSNCSKLIEREAPCLNQH